MNPLKKKTVSVISYLTIIGWLLVYFNYKKDRSSLVKFHLKQSFGLAILIIVSNLFCYTIIKINPALNLIFWVNNLSLFALWIAGITSAAYGVRLALPIIGTLFESKFSFIE